jgi:hypothetical protein
MALFLLASLGVAPVSSRTIFPSLPADHWLQTRGSDLASLEHRGSWAQQWASGPSWARELAQDFPEYLGK